MASPHYARIRAALKILGTMIGANDLFIAAHFDVRLRRLTSPVCELCAAFGVDARIPARHVPL